MSKCVAVFLLLSLSLAAQSKPDNNISPTTRLYEPKYLKGDRAESVAHFVQSLLVVPSKGLVSVAVGVRWERSQNLMVITAQQPEGLDRAETLLKRFDVPEPPRPPAPQAAMTIYLVRAITDANRAQGASVPPELEPAVKEMKSSLSYAGFKLVDTINVVVRDGLRLEDALPNAAANNNLPHFYSVEFNGVMPSADGKALNLGTFKFAVRIPLSSTGGVQYQEESIATPLTIVGDQKLVLGKITIAPSLGDALFVVLSRK